VRVDFRSAQTGILALGSLHSTRAERFYTQPVRAVWLESALRRYAFTASAGRLGDVQVECSPTTRHEPRHTFQPFPVNCRFPAFAHVLHARCRLATLRRAHRSIIGSIALHPMSCRTRPAPYSPRGSPVPFCGIAHNASQRAAGHVLWLLGPGAAWRALPRRHSICIQRVLS